MTNKKELIKQYKQTIQEMGIYQIKNRINGKLLIGNAKNLKGILNSHKFQLKTGRHFNQALQQDFNKYGETNFDYEIIDYLKPKEDQNYNYTEDLNTLEEMWLEKLQPYDDKGYNSKKIKLNPLTSG
jgi:group I intron endonuclease